MREVFQVFNVLVTNDDGINSPGLITLIKTLTGSEFKVWVCAPDGERSAASHSITMHSPLRVTALSLSADKMVENRWCVGGSPVDCVKLAIEELMPLKPDIVVSGINSGFNLGTDVMYSGTVSAAAEAAIYGIPSLAISLSDKGCSYDFETAATVARRVVCAVLKNGLPSGVFLNVNVPKTSDNTCVSDFRLTRVGTLRYSNVFDRRTDPRGRVYYWMCGNVMAAEDGDGYDTYAVDNGFVSISPLKIDVTDHSCLEKMKNWNFD